MNRHGKEKAMKTGFPSQQIDWSDEEDLQVYASYGELAELLQTEGKMCPICKLPINKRTHPWDAKHGCQ